MEEEVVRKFQDVFLPGASYNYNTTQTATFILVDLGAM